MAVIQTYIFSMATTLDHVYNNQATQKGGQEVCSSKLSHEDQQFQVTIYVTPHFLEGYGNRVDYRWARVNQRAQDL